MKENIIESIFECLKGNIEHAVNDLRYCAASEENKKELVSAIANTLAASQPLFEEIEKAYNKQERNTDLERACKNQAYFFILENGLLEVYKAYAERNPLKDFENCKTFERLKKLAVEE